jgi:DUF4097 and DUF4098 domain-containing protein YvlB
VEEEKMKILQRYSFLPVFLMLLTSAATPSFCIDSQKEKEYRENFSFSAGGSLSLSNVSGSVKISSWEKDEFDLRAVKSVRKVEDQSKAQEMLEKVKIKVERKGDRIEVSTEYPKGFFNKECSSEKPEGEAHDKGLIKSLANFLDGLHECVGSLFDEMNKVEVSYEIKVPRKTNVSVSSVSGDIELEKLEGEIEASGVNGAVNLAGLSGKQTASMVNGRINVIDPSGTMEYSTVNGEITVRIGPEGKIKQVGCSAINGEISLILSQGMGLSVDCSTLSGTIDLDSSYKFTGEKTRHGLEGTIGGGGPNLSASTINGTIRFKTL